MFKLILAIFLSISAFSVAVPDNHIGLIITNYQYDRFGRPIRTVQQPNPYYNNSPYYTPYYDPYYPTSLPGADPDRMEAIFEENQK